TVLRGEKGAVVGIRGEKNAGESVVVLLRDRIELMIVAAGACGGDAEESLRDGIDLFVGEIERELSRVRLVNALRPDRQKPGGDELLGTLPVVPGREEIAGDLLAQELAIRL